MNEKIHSLMSTGFGFTREKSLFLDTNPREIKDLLMDKGFVIIKDLSYNEDSFRPMVSQYGKAADYIISSNEKKAITSEQKDILKLNGEKGKVVTGRGGLPLHSDGALQQRPIDLGFLYAELIENIDDQGATNICDHKLPVEEMSSHLRRILEEEKFEYKYNERGVYDGSTSEWSPLTVFTDLGWVRKMMISFPFPKGQSNHFDIRIVGFQQAQIDAFFEELNKFLMKPRYFYKHYWKTGDLLIFDNRRVLHGRDPFDNNDNNVRILYRAQVMDHDGNRN